MLFYCIGYAHTQDRIIASLDFLRRDETIYRLKRKEDPKLRCDIRQWAGIVSEQFVQTFQSHAAAQLTWYSFHFNVPNGDPENIEGFCRVVETAVHLRLCKGFYFKSASDMHPMELRLGMVISLALRQPSLRDVTVADFAISVELMAVLATGISTVGRNEGLSNLRFYNNEFERREGALMGAWDYLRAGLASNRTLKELSIEPMDIGANADGCLAGIIRVLSKHPCLEILKLNHFEYGMETMQALRDWLESETCCLRELYLECGFEHPDSVEQGMGANAFSFFCEELPMNGTLEVLSFANQENVNINSIGRLIGNLGRLGNLTELNLESFGIEDFELLTAHLPPVQQVSRLRLLNLDHNNCCWMLSNQMVEDPFNLQESSRRHHIMRLLTVFPVLGYLGRHFYHSLGRDCLKEPVGMQLERNRCLGMLKAGSDVPRSVWPLIMAKANEDVYPPYRHDLQSAWFRQGEYRLYRHSQEERRATMLFEMLRVHFFVNFMT